MGYKWNEDILIIDNVFKSLQLTRSEHSKLSNILSGLQHYILTIEAKLKEHDKSTIKPEAKKEFNTNGYPTANI